MVLHGSTPLFVGYYPFFSPAMLNHAVKAGRFILKREEKFI
jgi:hypothetical protein